jgi:hypothetical protein
VVFADSLASRGHTLEVAIANCTVSTLIESTADAFGHFKTEGGGVTCIESEDVDALSYHTLGFGIQRATDVRMNVTEFICTLDHCFSP